MTNVFLRISANLFLFMSILFLPWWFSTLVVLCMLLFFDAYEVIMWGLFADALYGAPLPLFFNFVFVFTLLFTLLFLIISFIKQFFVFYKPSSQ